MKIKKAGIEDLKTVSMLFDQYRQFYEQQPDPEKAEEFLSERILKNESVIFIAMDEKTESGTGFVQLYPSFSSVSMKRLWILNDLFVCKEFRRTGTAEALIKETRKFAEQTDAKGLVLETHSENIQAQKLYDKTGFKKDKEHYYYFLGI